MKPEKIELIIASKFKYINVEQAAKLRFILAPLPEKHFTVLSALKLKDPLISLLISFFVGGLGIDRFYIGDVGIGMAKLFTLGGCGIWAFVDLFFIMGATKRKNFELLLSFCELDF